MPTMVISRSCGESIMISDDLLLTVQKLRGGRVLISVSPPAMGGRLSFPEETHHRWLDADEVVTLREGVTCSHFGTRNEIARLGLTVPEGVSVHRKEVYDAIKEVRGSGGAG